MAISESHRMGEEICWKLSEIKKDINNLLTAQKINDHAVPALERYGCTRTLRE